jgi:hypothetical protein
MVISGGVTILLGVVPGAVIGIILFLQAIFITGIFPIGFVCMARLFDREMMSMAVGFVTVFTGLFGAGLIPYLLGLSGDLISFRFGITILGILLTMISWLVRSLRDL